MFWDHDNDFCACPWWHKSPIEAGSTKRCASFFCCHAVFFHFHLPPCQAPSPMQHAVGSSSQLVLYALNFCFVHEPFFLASSILFPAKECILCIPRFWFLFLPVRIRRITNMTSGAFAARSLLCMCGFLSVASSFDLST